MKTNSKPNLTFVYQKQSDRLRAIFDGAASPKKILCVALDFATAKHVALICDGKGDILKKAFPVINSSEGVDFLTPFPFPSGKKRDRTFGHAAYLDLLKVEPVWNRRLGL